MLLYSMVSTMFSKIVLPVDKCTGRKKQKLLTNSGFLWMAENQDFFFPERAEMRRNVTKLRPLNSQMSPN